jgi:CRP-like cAMP-binding protein
MKKSNKDFTIISGKNYKVLRTQDFGDIVFGCPPGIVKDFAQREEDLPSKYVIPFRTFVKGRNNFDFEFIVYSFLFVKDKKEKLSIFCMPGQEERFRIILSETLFGPTFLNLLRAQFRKLPIQNKFSDKESKQFDIFLQKLAKNKRFFESFDLNLKEHNSEKQITDDIKNSFDKLLKETQWLARKKIKSLSANLTQNYLVCAYLKREMSLFTLARESQRVEFIDRIVDFYHFDDDWTVTVKGKNDKRKKLKMVQPSPSIFDLYIGKQKKLEIDISSLEPPDTNFTIQPCEKPFMGATFLGVGSGFTPNRKNSCMIAWSEGKGIMVDVLAECNVETMKYGITENDVPYTFLTHVHSDHDAGITEKILYGEKVKVISTRIIFESYLRKLEAITCFPIKILEDFFDFHEVEPNKPTKLPGFQNSYFEFDYSLHSIPTGRFTLTYKEKGFKKTIAHSGDTKYDEERISIWYEQGFFTKKRRDAILGFIWDADLIVHDVGGGMLHTHVDALKNLDKSITDKLILVHQHHEPAANQTMHFAEEGQTEVLIKERKLKKEVPLQSLKEGVLFRKLKQNHFLELCASSEIKKFKDQEIVFSQDEEGHSFFVIVDGFAEIIIDKEKYAIYEKGNFFGELAITTTNPRRRATVRAKGSLCLLEIKKEDYKKFKLPLIKDDYYKLESFFSDTINPSLLAILAFGTLEHWTKDETVIKHGSLEKDMYVLLSGEVRILDKKNKELASLSEGAIVGEIAYMKNVPRTASVLAASNDVYAIRLKTNQISNVFKLFPSFYGMVYQQMKKKEINF